MVTTPQKQILFSDRVHTLDEWWRIRKFLKFLPDAEQFALHSKDRSTQVGAIALDDDYTVRSMGYNGFPRGVSDSVEARHERPAKYKWTSHAEENLVAQASRAGIPLFGCTMLITALYPCSTCSRLIIQSGIKRILAAVPNNDRWLVDAEVSREMLAEAGVDVIYYTTDPSVIDLTTAQPGQVADFQFINMGEQE